MTGGLRRVRPQGRHLLRSFAEILAGWAVRLHQRRRPGRSPGAPGRGSGADQRR